MAMGNHKDKFRSFNQNIPKDRWDAAFGGEQLVQKPAEPEHSVVQFPGNRGSLCSCGGGPDCPWDAGYSGC